MSITENLTVLVDPLTAEEIEWKVQNYKNGRTMIAPYIDSRAVMNRFDRAFGAFGWQNQIISMDGGALAGIGVKNPDDEWIWKWDGAGASDYEPIKGSISGAMKRAATQWGLGRELYNYPRVYIIGEHKYVPYAVLERLNGLPAAIAKKQRLPEVITLDEHGKDARGR